MAQPNQTIRRTAAAAGVRLWQIADRMGYSECYFSRLLRKDLPADKQAEALRIIAELEQEAG